MLLINKKDLYFAFFLGLFIFQFLMQYKLSTSGSRMMLDFICPSRVTSASCVYIFFLSREPMPTVYLVSVRKMKEIDFSSSGTAFFLTSRTFVFLSSSRDTPNFAGFSDVTATNSYVYY